MVIQCEGRLVSMSKCRTQDFRLGGVVYGQVKTLNNTIDFFQILCKGFLKSHGCSAKTWVYAQFFFFFLITQVPNPLGRIILRLAQAGSGEKSG